MRTGTLAALVLFAAASPLACHHSVPPDQAIAELKNPDPDRRQEAADSLRTDNGVPPNAVPALLEALKTEQTPKVRGAELITLGRSGAPDAKPVIDDAVQNAKDPDMRRWASRALKYWMIATKQLPADHAFPEGWPYGQPGYPPPLPAQ